MDGTFDRNARFLGQSETLGRMQPLPPDARPAEPDTPTDEALVFWEGTPDKSPEERSHIIRQIGARPINELIAESVQRHPASYQPKRYHY